MQKKVSSTQTYEARIFTVSKDIIVDDQGHEFERDIVHHHGGVGVIVIQNGNILLVRQYRPAIDQMTLEIPAGKLEFQEDPYTCGLRELEEETGYQAQSLHKVCECYSTPGFCSEKLHIYEAKDIVKLEHPKAMDEDEEIELQWLDIQEALLKVQRFEIQDAKTIIAIQYAAQKRS